MCDWSHAHWGSGMAGVGSEGGIDLYKKQLISHVESTIALKLGMAVK